MLQPVHRLFHAWEDDRPQLVLLPLRKRLVMDAGLQSWVVELPPVGLEHEDDGATQKFVLERRRVREPAGVQKVPPVAPVIQPDEALARANKASVLHVCLHAQVLLVSAVALMRLQQRQQRLPEADAAKVSHEGALVAVLPRHHLPLCQQQLPDCPEAGVGVAGLWVHLEREVWHRQVDVRGRVAHGKSGKLVPQPSEHDREVLGVDDQS
mmetsp:Transcript_32459/g.96905  ORF Transcript_32459/g.96905 Transcript_32459/m.96905 type:complete len:210 (-) Transcript_32459:131-760(-)